MIACIITSSTPLEHPLFHLSPSSKYNEHAKPYWTAEVKQSHAIQRSRRVEWILSGRPRDRDNPQYIAYKAAKREFKHAQAHAIEMIQTNFYSDLDASSNCDMRLFWSLVNTKRKKKRNAITHLLTDNGTSTNQMKLQIYFAITSQCFRTK